MRGSFFEIGGYAAGQVIRLCSNLILSRMLFPEAYGLIAIASVFLYGAWMLSDVGIHACVMRSPNGDNPRFLQTAWTLHIIRGMIMFAVVCAIAWPASWIYHKPMLGPVIAVSALTLAIDGFSSTVLLTLSRHVQRAPLVALEVLSQILTLVLMVSWASIHASVWALVAGTVGSKLLTTIGSHFIRPRAQHAFLIDEEAAHEFRNFGKWVFGSSAFTFLAQEADRLVLAYFVDLSTLGVYSIATLLGGAIGAVISRLAGSVVFGVLSTTVRERPGDLKRVYYDARLRLDLLAMPALGVIFVFGPTIVALLYDNRYHAAGWMLQVLCLRVALSCLSSPASYCIISLGEPRQTMFGQVMRFIAIWAGIPIGWHLFGLKGVLWATVASELVLLLALWIACYRHKLLRFSREALAGAAFAGGAGAGYVLKIFGTPWAEAGIAALKHLKAAY